MTGQERPEVIFIDVYSTLLDMSDVERRVNDILDSTRGYTLWLELFMQYCFVDNCTVQYNSFEEIGKATMQMTAKLLGRKIGADKVEYIFDLMKQLPLNEGVQKGLSRMYDQGFRIGALTNAPEKIVAERMDMTGLISYFELVLSAEHIRKYKPSIEVYTWAAKQAGVAPSKVLLISSHGWDLAGAANAGMQTAFISHPKLMLYPLAPSPEFTARNIEELAEQLVMAYPDGMKNKN